MVCVCPGGFSDLTAIIVLHSDILSELGSFGQLPVGHRNAPCGHEYDLMGSNAGDMGEPMSTEDMLRLMLKSPSLRPDCQDVTPPQEHIDSVLPGGATQINSNVSAAALPPIHPPEEPFPLGIDASREMDDIMDLIDGDAISVWLNAPTGFEYVFLSHLSFGGLIIAESMIGALTLAISVTDAGRRWMGMDLWSKQRRPPAICNI